MEQLLEKGKEMFHQRQEWVRSHPCPPASKLDAYKAWYSAKEEFERSLAIQREFRCPTCKDRNWVMSGDTDLVPCPDCSPFDYSKAMLRYTGIPEWHYSKTFETFRLDEAPMMEEALRAAMEFADGYAVPWLVLVGPMGCGKTHLAYAVANQMARRRQKVRFWVVAELLDKIRATYNLKDEGEEAEKAQNVIDGMVHEPEVLILDDLGVEKYTNQRGITTTIIRKFPAFIAGDKPNDTDMDEYSYFDISKRLC